MSASEDFKALEKEYNASDKEGANFLKKLSVIKEKYSGFRRVRGDGSCFYRAYVFGLLEQLLVMGDKTLSQAVCKRVAESYSTSDDDFVFAARRLTHCLTDLFAFYVFATNKQTNC